jgi:ABC-type transporter Mla subunit MlaD
MRRVLLAAALACMLAATGAALAANPRAQGSSTGSFYVIFDDAKGLIDGQLVKVAGAQAGTIENVTLTRGYKARIKASIESKFLPFHQDATCTIRPQGLIAENYLECDPGTENSPILRGPHGGPPTVPVSHTTEPVSLLDLFNIFNLPTRERVSVLIDELGIGTAAEGANLNAILRRANPALALADQAIGILARQRAQLARAIDATGTIAAQGAAHTAALQSFLQRTAQVTETAAAHRRSLSATVARLPGLLAAAAPALAQTDLLVRDGTPLLAQLRTAAPLLVGVDRDFRPFVRVAVPGLDRVAAAIRTAIPAIRRATPLVHAVRAYLQRSLASTRLFSRLMINLQAHGFIENFFSIAYYIAASLARHDSVSHMLAVLLVGPDNGACGNYSTKPVSGCQAHYGSQPSYTPEPDTRFGRRARVGRRRSRARAGAATASAAVASGVRSGGGRPAGATRIGPLSVPPLPQLPASSLPSAAGASRAAAADAGQALQHLASYLLR